MRLLLRATGLPHASPAQAGMVGGGIGGAAAAGSAEAQEAQEGARGPHQKVVAPLAGVHDVLPSVDVVLVSARAHHAVRHLDGRGNGSSAPPLSPRKRTHLHPDRRSKVRPNPADPAGAARPRAVTGFFSPSTFIFIVTMPPSQWRCSPTTCRSHFP